MRLTNFKNKYDNKTGLNSLFSIGFAIAPKTGPDREPANRVDAVRTGENPVRPV